MVAGVALTTLTILSDTLTEGGVGLYGGKCCIDHSHYLK